MTTALLYGRNPVTVGSTFAEEAGAEVEDLKSHINLSHFSRTSLLTTGSCNSLILDTLLQKLVIHNGGEPLLDIQRCINM